MNAGLDASADPLPAAPDQPSARLAALAATTTFESLTSGAVHAVARHLVDAVGCALGALDSRPALAARAIATTAAVDHGASVFGLPHATTPEVAAFANAAMVRRLDFNGTGHGGHPSDTVAAVLAAAEWRRTPGATSSRRSTPRTRRTRRCAAQASTVTSCGAGTWIRSMRRSAAQRVPASSSVSTPSAWPTPSRSRSPPVSRRGSPAPASSRTGRAAPPRTAR
ncbi:MAG: MmgE/PrpD family protein [Rubrivivax sp.]|nr:MmgE/PrpD family protein [Rubrivivax sp.]